MDKKERWINDYLDGNLSQEELQSLIDKEGPDSELLEEAQLAKVLTSTLRAEKKVTLKKEFSSMLSQAQSLEGAGRSLFSNTLYKVAAVISMALLVSVFLFYQFGDSPGSSELFDEYYQPFAVSSSFRGENSRLSEAQQLYEEGEFERAAVLFENAYVANPKDLEIQLLLSNCYLSTGQAEKAIPLLENVKGSNDGFQLQYGHWYLALAYLQQGSNEQSIQNLRLVVEKEMLYASKAKALLEELK